MTRKQVEQKLNDITKLYKTDVGQSKKISSKVTRDALIEVFTVRCPNDIYRDKDSIIVLYQKKYYDMVFEIKRNERYDTCHIQQSVYCNGDLVKDDKYRVSFPDDVKLLKRKVKEDTYNFYNTEGA